MRYGMSLDRSATLEDQVVRWIVEHDIEQPANIDFILIASACSDGAFLTAEPVEAAMRHADGEHELVVSAIRREAAAQIQDGGA